MFAARGIAISLSVFVMVYCALSLGASLAWRTVWQHVQGRPVRRIADLLFALRMLPLGSAAIITAAFTVPSFLLLEPRSIDEPLGGIPLVVGIAGALLGIFGVVNAARAVRRTSRTVSIWTNQAQPVDACSPIPVLRISPAVPAMTAAGILRPRVLISGVAEFLLTANELQTALNHEIEHVRRQDNLKKLLLHFVAFPGMSGLEAAWLEATEMAADDAAVSNAGEALDLAAALIKLSRLGPAATPADLTVALIHDPASAMNARIERLISWSNDRLASPGRFSLSYGLGAALAAVAVCGIPYSHLLVRIHTATEWLVR
jgi:beta-lactamase regulating signal transducer with metallopeptidase domain